LDGEKILQKEFPQCQHSDVSGFYATDNEVKKSRLCVYREGAAPQHIPSLEAFQ